MYGDKASELIKGLTRESTDVIQPYQYELVKQIMKENDELYAENLKTSQSVPEPSKAEPLSEAPTNDNNLDNGKQDFPDKETVKDETDIGEKEIMVMQVRHTAKLWNKRCIIAYHFERLNLLKKLRWEIGNNLPNEIVRNLSKQELEWFTNYSDNLFSYMNTLNSPRGLDLTLYMRPPKKLYIQVKCIRDYGQFDLEDGNPVMLKKDSIHFLPLSQCEKLIHQGILEQTSI